MEIVMYDIIIFVYVINIEGVYISTCIIGRPYIDSSNHECYWLVETLQSFKDSLRICRNDNGSLAVISNQKVLDFLNAFRKDLGYEFKTFYIGYQTVNGSLETLNGKRQAWATWETGQPSGTGRCVSSGFINGRFWDEKCTSFSYAICQGQHNFDPCQCLCRATSDHLDITTNERFEIARNISRKLAVNKETLSSTVRSKTSAEDLRPSAARIGYVGSSKYRVVKSEYRVAKSEYRVIKSEYREAKSEYRVVKSEYRVTKSEYRVAKNEYRVTKSEFQVAKREYRVIKSEYRVAKSEYRVVKSEYRVTKSEYRVAKSEYRVTKICIK
ncbi:unnamed protein product [Mytilus coruscus]|uniref:C-type lectin domain-containing protein n=1 Tax=Mytilus coruscus TaxID=42192 RepID=A0A6J8EHC7_MYTCO|nr:unnamed protein product [Mytilus coruscus]